jgi:glycerophosphoryl diester phosphodiesterase
LLSHLLCSMLVLAVMTPLVSLTIRGAVALSGQPALSDFDIALHLLSPLGFVAALVAASVLLSTAVLDSAFMMAIAQDARQTGQGRFEAGVARVLPRLPQIIGFAWRLLLRVLVITVPFLVAALLVAQHWLTDRADVLRTRRAARSACGRYRGRDGHDGSDPGGVAETRAPVSNRP